MICIDGIVRLVIRERRRDDGGKGRFIHGDH